MYPSLSPIGASRYGEESTRSLSIGRYLDLFNKEDLDKSELNELLNLCNPKYPRSVHNRERMDSYLTKKPMASLPKTYRKQIMHALPLTSHRGLRNAAVNLLNSNCKTISCFIRTWTWIDTCLALSFDEETEAITEFKFRWWIIVANDIAGAHTAFYAVKKWASFGLYLTLHFGGAIQPQKKWEPYFPQVPKGTWLSKDPTELTVNERAQCRILSDKRGFPAGDGIAKSKALEAHIQALTKNTKLTDQNWSDLEAASKMAADSVRKCIGKKWFGSIDGHVSVSNTGCYERDRSGGGKRQYVLDEVIKWLEVIPTASRTVVLPTGEAFLEKEGIPRWQTVKPPLMDEASSRPSNRRSTTGILTEDFQDGEAERIGFQLFSWAHDTLQKEGFLNEEGLPTGQPMPIKRVAIGEPGFKVRVATKSMAAFIVYGQPFAHAMRELLSHHPALKAGLSSGAQLHEWLKTVDSSKDPFPKYVMVGDFDAATDHIDHEAGRVAMHHLLDALNAPKKCYARNFVNLLLSPRFMETEDGDPIITTNGCLMGEPGTKIVLTFLALVANCHARGKVSKIFATAGDDQIDGSDDKDEILKYAEASKITTMVPSESKWGIFTLQATYCQQLLAVTGDMQGKEISIPKPRLLSPETKQSKGDDDTNPAYGKAMQFAREFSWTTESLRTLGKCMVALFLRNMHIYIERKPEVFLCREWGGLGLPGVLQRNLFKLLPGWHQKMVLHREEGHDGARRALGAWSTPHIMKRGFMGVNTDHIQNVVLEFCPTARIEDLELDCATDARYKTKLEKASEQGWVLLDHTLRMIQDSTTYANIWDTKQKSTRGYKSIPWDKRSEQLMKFSEELPDITRESDPVRAEWFPGKLVMLGSGCYSVYETEGGDLGKAFDAKIDLENGEIAHVCMPMMGSTAAPRMFLHYCNNRLLLNATSQQRIYGQKALSLMPTTISSTYCATKSLMDPSQ